MVVRLFTETPALLKPRDVIHFSKGWDERHFEDRYFKVERVQELHHDKWRIISAGGYHDLDLSDEDYGGLEPESVESLFEILVGWKPPQILCYPRIPTTDYFLTLEMTGWIPDTTSSQLRYLGAYTGYQTPYDTPRLRIHTVKDMEPIALRLYADSPENEKCIIGFLVNRCEIREIKYEEMTEKEKERVREIMHYSLTGKGRWGE